MTELLRNYSSEKAVSGKLFARYVGQYFLAIYKYLSTLT